MMLNYNQGFSRDLYVKTYTIEAKNLDWSVEKNPRTIKGCKIIKFDKEKTNRENFHGIKSAREKK